MTHQVVSDNIHIQAAYEWLRNKGETHRMAEMLAFQEAPRANTDREFFEGLGTLDKQFDYDGKMHEGVVILR